MGLKLNGATSGSIEIDVPAVAGTDTAITIPATTGGEFIVSDSTGNIDLGPLDINGSASDDSVNIDGSGRLLVGTSSSRSTGGTQPSLQLEGTSFAQASLSLINNQNTGNAGYLMIGKSRGTALGSNTIVNNGDPLGIVEFYGADGSALQVAAKIEARVDGTPGANDMPGRLVFSTTADGASSPTQRTIIDLSGTLRPAADNTYQLGSLGTRWTSVWAANGTIQTSDGRQKLDITPSALGTDFIKSLRPVSYRWKIGGNIHNGTNEDGSQDVTSIEGSRTHWGFIAQEVKQAVDAAGVDFGGWVLTDKNDPDSQQALRYDQFIAPLTKALQEAISKIEALETANASQAATIAAFEARLTALEGGAA